MIAGSSPLFAEVVELSIVCSAARRFSKNARGTINISASEMDKKRKNIRGMIHGRPSRVHFPEWSDDRRNSDGTSLPLIDACHRINLYLSPRKSEFGLTSGLA